MLDMHAQTVSRGGCSRRDFLRAGALGMSGLVVTDLLGSRAFGQTPSGKAKAVIWIWLDGGPPHLDMFDPKPEAGEDYCGPLKNPIATNVPGIRIGELFPLLAKQADKYSIIRSMTHGNDGHETAAYIMLTGTMPARNITVTGGMISGDLTYPCIGSVVAFKKGQPETGYKGVLPPFIALTQAPGRFSLEGFLGSKYKPFATGGDPNAKEFRAQGLVLPASLQKRLEERRSLLATVSASVKANEKEAVYRAADAFQQQAYGLMLGDATKAFNLSAERDALRDRYGRHHFGQSCLLARRLVENGVPFITVNWPGWDLHGQVFESMRKMAPILDGGFSTLLADLAERAAGEHDCPLLRRVRQNAQDQRESAVAWRAGPLWQGILRRGGKGDQGRPRRRPERRPRRDRQGAAGLSLGPLGEHVYPSGDRPRGRLPHPQGCAAYVTPLASGGVQSGGMLTEIM